VIPPQCWTESVRILSGRRVGSEVKSNVDRLTPTHLWTLDCTPEHNRRRSHRFDLGRGSRSRTAPECGFVASDRSTAPVAHAQSAHPLEPEATGPHATDASEPLRCAVRTTLRAPGNVEHGLPDPVENREPAGRLPERFLGRPTRALFIVLPSSPPSGPPRRARKAPTRAIAFLPNASAGVRLCRRPNVLPTPLLRTIATRRIPAINRWWPLGRQT
jgi:hypothetical protein